MENHADGGAFPGAVGAEESEDVAPPDFDVQVINGRPVPVMFGQLKSAEDNVGHGMLSLLYVSYLIKTRFCEAEVYDGQLCESMEY
jgi:hypothetical protein